MHCYDPVSVRESVCPCVCVSVSSRCSTDKRLMEQSRKQHHTIGQGSSALRAKQPGPSTLKCVVQLHRNGPVDYRSWGVMQQCVYKTKTRDIGDLRKRLMQTWLTWLTSRATVWDHVCVLVANTFNTCCEIIVHMYYVAHQNILWNC